MDTKNTPPLRPLYPLEAAAVLAGIKPDLLQSAIVHGDVPGVRVLRLGPRKLRYVRSPPFLAWLEGQEPPPDPGPAADRRAESAVDADFDPVEYDDNLFA